VGRVPCFVLGRTVRCVRGTFIGNTFGKIRAMLMIADGAIEEAGLRHRSNSWLDSMPDAGDTLPGHADRDKPRTSHSTER